MLVESPIKETKVREGVYAYMYRSGVILIEKQKYVLYTMTDAIKQFRKEFPKYKKNEK